MLLGYTNKSVINIDSNFLKISSLDDSRIAYLHLDTVILEIIALFINAKKLLSPQN